MSQHSLHPPFSTLSQKQDTLHVPCPRLSTCIDRRITPTIDVSAKLKLPVGKETGETAHIERFNTTLRQRCANLVRRTLSFRKDEHWHEVRIRLFVDHYNRQLERTGCLASV